MVVKYKYLSILIYKVIILVALTFLQSCSSGKKDQLDYVERDLHSIYETALNNLIKKNYKQASLEFDEVERQHPYSDWSKKAILMSSYASFKNKDFIKTETNLLRYINLYPASKLTAYAQYLLGMNHFAQIIDVGRDQTAVINAIETFKLILDRYPGSNYAKDSYYKIIYLESSLAAKELDVAMTYLSLKKYIAAVKRLKSIVNNYQTTSYVPEALHRLVELYIILGVTDEAIVNARVLGYNYPNSEWYALSYDLLKKNNIYFDQ